MSDYKKLLKDHAKFRLRIIKPQPQILQEDTKSVLKEAKLRRINQQIELLTKQHKICENEKDKLIIEMSLKKATAKRKIIIK